MMNLRHQPPRRPSNLSMAGIVGLARMTDKARAHNDEELGEYVYGDDSGLDAEVLEFIGATADEFAEAAGEQDDAALGEWAAEKAGKTQAEIEEFNSGWLNAEFESERGRQLLQDVVAKYAPGRTDIKTIFQTTDLDDWGSFWEVDLTGRPPRSPHCKDVGGIFGIARGADKARAARAGKLGEYNFGEDSGLDRKIFGALGISIGQFQDAAVNNPNDTELGTWVLEQSGKTPEEIAEFNRIAASVGPEDAEDKAEFDEWLKSLDPSRTDIKTYADVVDLEDEVSFGIVDLARHAPRSPYDTTILGMVQLARTTDKARAFNSDSLGEYWYGEDSLFDQNVLGFLGIAAQEFADAVKTTPTDEDVANWLKTRNPKTEAEVAAYNERTKPIGSTDEKHQAIIAQAVNRIDPSRTDVQTFFDLMVLDDGRSFA